MENIVQFIPTELMILLVCTPIIGELLKTNIHTKKIIPWALFIFDIVFAMLLMGNYAPITVLQGIAVWGVAIAGYDSFKVFTKQKRGN